MAKTKTSLRERMKQKKQDIAKRSSGGGGLIFLKEGTLRVRPLFVGEETDFLAEAKYFYFGPTIGGKISPSSFGEPCPAMEKYEKLKAGKEEDKEEAKKLVPKTKYFMAVMVYKDAKGKEVDEQQSGKLVLLSNSLAQNIIDLFLDEEWGDPTDPKEGYDLKLIREGKGQFDTAYSVIACPRTPNKSKQWSKQFDLNALLKEQAPSYEEMEASLAEFYGDDHEDEEAPKKKSSKVSASKEKLMKKVRTGVAKKKKSSDA